MNQLLESNTRVACTGLHVGSRQLFSVPLCGSTAYDHVYVRRRDNSVLQTKAYQCVGSSVMFKDPKKFTEQQRVEGIEQWGVPRPRES